MRDAAGELAHRLQLLALPELLLQGLALRHVPARRIEVVVAGDGVPRQPSEAPVARPHPHVQAVEDDAVHEVAEHPLHGGPVGRVDECVEVRADEVVLGPAERLGPGRVHRAVAAVEAAYEEQVAARAPDHVALVRPVAGGLLQDPLGLAPFGDVVEQDGDPAPGRFADAQGVDVEPPAECHRAALEAGRLARQGHPAVGIQPGTLQARDDLADPASGHVAEPGMAFERRVDLDEAVVDGEPGRIVAHLDDAEAGVHGLEQGAVARLALGEPAFLGAKPGDVELAREEVAQVSVRIEHRADVELVPERRAVAVVVQDLHDHVAPRRDGIADLGNVGGSVPGPWRNRQLRPISSSAP